MALAEAKVGLFNVLWNNDWSPPNLSMDTGWLWVHLDSFLHRTKIISYFWLSLSLFNNSVNDWWFIFRFIPMFDVNVFITLYDPLIIVQVIVSWIVLIFKSLTWLYIFPGRCHHLKTPNYWLQEWYWTNALDYSWPSMCVICQSLISYFS
jgi:hypothetical protein